MNRARLISILLWTALTCPLQAQGELPVDIDDPVYPLLEICEIRGALPPLSALKPYTEREVRGYLATAIAKKDALTAEELSALEGIEKGFARGDAPPVYFEAAGASDFRVDLTDTSALHSMNMAEAAIKGSLWSILSYKVDIEAFLDKVDPDAFPPFDFTKLWDGFHVWGENGQVLVSTGINSHLNFSSASLPELSVDLFDHALNLQLTRTRREWGLGEGSLSLSGTARPIEAFEGSTRPVSWAGFHFLAGTLGYWWSPTKEQKMFSIHRLELFPFDWLYISPWESVVYAKRLEISYLNPLMPYFFGQQIGGDLDNVAFGVDAAVTISPFVRLHASLFIDEISFIPLDTFFSRPKNQYAWQAGLKVPLPWPAWTLFTFQYTKIEPYCYTHYLQTVPQYTSPIDINFTNDGENIGYHLPPNSDEFLFRLFASPLAGMAVTVQYQLIRHGTGDHLAGQIEGDIDTPIIYDPPSVYPMKSFLNDGIYEWINVATLHIAYVFAAIRTSVWAEYSYVNATNYTSIVGNNVVMNLVGLGVRISCSTWATGE